MPEPAGHLPSKAARVLAAAGELVLARGSRGVTIAEVARKAHIGKGTVYLYWKTKEDLLLDLVCRDFLSLADEIVVAVTDDPDLARPSRLCVNMLRATAAHPYVSALSGNDEELLGAMTDDPRSATLLDTLGPDAVMRQILPIWRANDLARTDWHLGDQALALDSLVSGFKLTTTRRPAPQVDDPGRVLAAAVTALLGPERATPQQVRATAAEGIRTLGEKRAVVLELLSQPVAPR
ncbi:TetR/AcrR family transcriptional regulator [Kibdelosporangium persicum]|uniref:DNA-binding transcriptional regulator, AcrR family n=1 Tax=Kibdelosporangium persicum TaxID=2698649 RepID=A0ABX2FI94_9PSEU|nr:TetR/AcrR family transcriptional regulator [Kibdelosporangium persicum]NRN71134.1 DNA-binding transcriptional regulator, AcrR family [Kibdelosporangium persicum]